MPHNPQPLTHNPNPRLLSLDVFRGMTVAAMILVNNPGDWGNIYAPLKHAEWHGCTPTDLIFPFFLFIVGVAIAYALGGKKDAGTDQRKLIVSIIKRSFNIFALGFLLALIFPIFWDPIKTFQTVRIPGVLQRIALVYLITSLIFLKTSYKAQFKIFIGLLVLYWALMMFVPVPGVGYPNLEKETNLGAWLDRSILGTAHLWKEAVTWDPEGLLGTIPAVATGMFGLLVGTWLKRKVRDESTKVAWLFSAGIAAVILGLLWDLEFPINKALWTSSYVLYTGGLATMGLALCYWIIDVQGYNRWTKPFMVYGVNAITVFFFSAVIAKTMNLIKVTGKDGALVSSKTWIMQTFFNPYFSPINASLGWAIFFVLFWMAILWWMYNRKIIIKV